MSKIKIAIIGDVHGFWDHRDTEYFNSSDYDFLLFTGDLRSYTEREDKVAKRISGLNKKAYLIPGNTDTSNLFQATGEIFRNQFLIQNFHLGQNKKLQKMKDSLGNIQLSAYQTHLISKDKISFNLIILRPFAMGVNLSYAPILKKKFGIESLEDSKERYRKLIDDSSEPAILFLGHNGPFGLGSKISSLWSSDFTKEPLDWGDTDYRYAIDYAKSRGKKVLAAVAGHMHHKIKRTNINRNWFEEQSGTYFINAAKVPRIFLKDNKTVRYHIEMLVKDSMEITLQEMLIE